MCVVFLKIFLRTCLDLASHVSVGPSVFRRGCLYTHVTGPARVLWARLSRAHGVSRVRYRNCSCRGQQPDPVAPTPRTGFSLTSGSLSAVRGAGPCGCVCPAPGGSVRLRVPDSNPHTDRAVPGPRGGLSGDLCACPEMRYLPQGPVRGHVPVSEQITMVFPKGRGEK